MKPVAPNPGKPLLQPSGCSVRHHGLREPSDPAKTQGAVELGTVARYVRGIEIIAQGEADSRVGLIVSGLIKVSMTRGNGDSFIVQILHEGQLVGEPWTNQTAFSWAASTDTGICWLTPESVLRPAGSNNTQFLGLPDILAGQLREAQLSSLSLRGRNSLQRIAYWVLAQVCGDSGKVQNMQFQILLSRRDLASLLDMTVETLSRVMHQLDEHGAIALLSSDTVRVKDIAQLCREAKLPASGIEGELPDNGWKWGSKALRIGPAALEKAKEARGFDRP